MIDLTNPRRVVILAGNYKQACRLNDEKLGYPRHELRYASSIESLMGLRDFALIRTGTWYEREDELIAYIERESKCRRMTIIDMPL